MLIVGAGECGTRAALALREAGYDGPVTLSAPRRTPPYERPPLSKDALVAESPSAQADRRLRAPRRGGDRLPPGAHRNGDRPRRPRRALRRRSRARLRQAADRHRRPAARRCRPPRAAMDAAHPRRRRGDPRRARAGAAARGDRRRLHRPRARRLRPPPRRRGRGDRGAAAPPEPRRAGGDRRGAPRPARRGRRPLPLRRPRRGARPGSGIALADGSLVPSDLVVVGIGAVPNTELGAAAGLAVDNGLAVDATLATSDPAIFAAGDCCSFPHPLYDGRRLRLESWRSAQEQGTLAAQEHARATRADLGGPLVLVRPVRPDPADRRPRRRRRRRGRAASSTPAPSSSSISPRTAACSPPAASAPATPSPGTSASPRC